MWKLTKPDEELRKWYEKKMLDSLAQRITDDRQLSDRIKEILLPSGIDKSGLKKLLLDEPISSKAESDRMMRLILDHPEVSTEKKKKEITENLLNVFDYEHQISKNKSRAYWITKKLGKNTCTYCNRTYIYTVIKDESPIPYRINSENRIARPHLDHWLDKAKNPLLSLNLYNLIPSCAMCNSSIKGGISFDFTTHIHPYLYDQSEPPFEFRMAPNPKKNPTIPYIVSIIDDKCSAKEKQMISDLSLREVYAYHGMLEAKDLFDWKIDNSAGYLHDLFNTVLKKYGRSTEDIFRMFFGTEYLPDKNLDRPLSKLKRDILIQLEILDKTGNFRS